MSRAGGSSWRRAFGPGSLTGPWRLSLALEMVIIPGVGAGAGAMVELCIDHLGGRTEICPPYIVEA